MIKWFGIVLVVLTISTLFTAGIFWIEFRVQENRCMKTLEEMKVQGKFSFSTLCLVKVGDRYVPLKNIRF